MRKGNDGGESGGGGAGDDLSPLVGLPATEETWLAGSVPVHRWIVTKRGRALRPDAFLVLSGRDVVGVRIEPEGPGPARALELILRMMERPLTGSPRRPARIHVADEGAAGYLGAELRPLGVEVAVGAVTETLTERIRTVERRAGGGFPLRGLLDVTGMDEARLVALFSAASKFHRLAPWRQIPDGEPVQVTCEAWSRPTWYASVMGATSEVRGLALHPTWRALLAIFAGEEEDAAPDVLALAFGDRTQVPFEDLDSVADLDLDVDGNEGYPLVFRCRPEGEVARPTLEELEILEACLLAFTAFAAIETPGARSAIVEVETCTGRRRLTLERRT
jgi:hypothetical protein